MKDKILKSLSSFERNICYYMLLGFNDEQIAKKIGIKYGNLQNVNSKMYHKFETLGFLTFTSRNKRNEFSDFIREHFTADELKPVLAVQPSLLDTQETESGEVISSPQQTNTPATEADCMKYQKEGLLLLITQAKKKLLGEVKALDEAYRILEGV